MYMRVKNRKQQQNQSLPSGGASTKEFIEGVAEASPLAVWWWGYQKQLKRPENHVLKKISINELSGIFSSKKSPNKTGLMHLLSMDI